MMCRLRAMDDLAWACGGDFNVLLSLSEKMKGSDKSIVSMRGFRKAVDDCDLIDLGFSGSKFTWNNREKDTKGRDSCFKFEPFWLKDEDISKVIEIVWAEKSPSQNSKDLKSKLNWCVAKFSGWSKEHFGSLRKSIEGQQKLIDSLYVRSHVSSVMEQIKVLERELEGLIECEEIYWRQRVRTDWLAAGYRNLNFSTKEPPREKRKISSLSCWMGTTLTRSLRKGYLGSFSRTSPFSSKAQSLSL
ncbi:hypothetical protein Ddye_016525 [Dipteronia dyeriana]|uniref:Endonuclease/exonuclease/phosphatase n=1 Tax=Dipteronia dyeriana TaxID=168575 RepID=A0AAD9WZN5_9ROSI|nr:hypothetical protein Ddye_016525 [Dipteronia dyeriana]